MIRALWLWLTGRRATPPDPCIDYDPDRDPLVRQIRYQRRQAERATQRIQRQANLIEQAHMPRREGGS